MSAHVVELLWHLFSFSGRLKAIFFPASCLASCTSQNECLAALETEGIDTGQSLLFKESERCSPSADGTYCHAQ